MSDSSTPMLVQQPAEDDGAARVTDARSQASERLPAPPAQISGTFYPYSDPESA